MDNQLFAVIARPPVVGGKVVSFDASRALEVPGVESVHEIPAFAGAPKFQPLGGIAVCANSTWAAWAGRDALEIEWDDGPNATYDTDVFAAELAETVKSPGRVMRSTGNANEVIANS